MRERRLLFSFYHDYLQVVAVDRWTVSDLRLKDMIMEKNLDYYRMEDKDISNFALEMIRDIVCPNEVE